MDRLTGDNQVDIVEDVTVASDAETGLLTIEAIVTADNEASAVDEFVTLFRKVTAVDDPTVHRIAYMIIEKEAEILPAPPA